jgi:hypothetical protein
LQIGPLSQPGGQFNGIFIKAPTGIGVYTLSKMMLMSSKSAEHHHTYIWENPVKAALSERPGAV